MNAKERFVRARSGLLLDHFFFGRLALYLKLVERPEIPTLAVDGKHIFYNAEFIESLSPILLKSAIAHEVMHCVFEHISRRNGREPRLWNIAGDYVINDVLAESGFEIGRNWLQPQAAFKGMSAEHIYDILKQENKDDNGAGLPDPLCDIMQGESQAEQSEQTLEWKIAAVGAASEAKKRGKLPAAFERFIDDITSSKVPWREVLHRFVTQLAKDDYNWQRLNRRFLARGLYLPSLYSENMGRLQVVIDTSGSIDQHTLNVFGSEIHAIVASSQPEKTEVVYCDAAINHVDEFDPNDQIKFKLHGGGGTDFRPPFQRIDAGETEEPVALIYLTDGYGTFPDEAPSYPVLWCMTTDVEAPFGETLRIEV